MKNTKKKFPQPGPSDHFMDEKVARKYHKEKSNIIAIRDNTKKYKSRMPLAARVCYFSA